jgi:hypothetical protein
MPLGAISGFGLNGKRIGFGYGEAHIMTTCRSQELSSVNGRWAERKPISFRLRF